MSSHQRVAHHARSFMAITLFASLSLSLSLTGTTRADAQVPIASALDELIEVTPWVVPGESWIARFAVPPQLPPGALVTITVHAALGGTDAAIDARLTAQDEGQDLGRTLATLPPVRVLELIEPTNSIRIAVPIATRPGTADGVSLPTPGVYPVSISIEDDAGAALGTTVIHLVADRVRASDPSDADQPDDPSNPPVQTMVLVRSDASDAYRPDDGSADLDSARQMAQRLLDVLAGDLRDRPSDLMTLLRSETLEALASSPAPNDRALLDATVAALNRTRALKAPWARTHVGAWLDQGGFAEVDRSLIAAQDAARALAGQILDPRVWAPDDSFTAAALSRLDRLGVEHYLVEADRLEPGRTPRGERGYHRPVLIGSPSIQRPAMVADPAVAAVLQSTVEAPLSAHRAITRIAAQSLSVTAPRRGDARRAALVVLDNRVSSATSAAFLRALTQRPSGPIAITPPELVFDTVVPLGRNADGTGDPLIRSLKPATPPPTVRPLARELPDAWERAESTRRMRPDDDPSASRLRVDLLGTTRATSTAAERAASLARATATSDATLNAVDAPARRTVTVTSRETTIPLRLTNRLDVPVNVQVLFESPRLQFLSGERLDAVLSPGVNRLDVPVTVRSSGVFVLRVRVTPPGALTTPRNVNGETLASSTVTVRSTAFSGVGLILSGGALLVLVVWWGRTLRRRDPDGPGASSPPTDSDPDPDVVDDQHEPSPETVPTRHRPRH